jgi:hypothetical protein
MKSVLAHDTDFLLHRLQQTLRAEGREDQARRIDGLRVEGSETVRVVRDVVSEIRVTGPRSRMVLGAVNELLEQMLVRPNHGPMVSAPVSEL